MKKLIICVSVLCVALIIGCVIYSNRHVSGEPDVVSSISTNRDEKLIVVANQKEIVDKELFAKDLIQKCLDNDFHKIRFSYDEGYPTSLDIDVYLWKEDIGNHNPVMQVSYQPSDWNQGYDIKNNPEQYELVISE